MSRNRRLLGLWLSIALWGCQPVYVKSLFPPTLSYTPAKGRKAETASNQAKQQPSPAPAASVLASVPTPEAGPPPEESGESAPSSGAGSTGSSVSGEHSAKQQQLNAPAAPDANSVKEAPKGPGPVLTLAPGGNPADAARSKQRAQDALKHATQQLTTLDRAKLAGQNAADYDLVAGLIRSAQEALNDQDSVRAQSLAEKAAALAEQLNGRIAPPH